MPKIARTSDLTERISFYKTTTTKDASGHPVTTNQLFYTCWAAVRAQYFSEVAKTYGTELADSLRMIIRYQREYVITSDMTIVWKGGYVQDHCPESRQFPPRMGHDFGKEGVVMANEVKVTLNGIDQNLKTLALANEKVRFTAEREAAKYVAQVLHDNTPYENENSTRSWHAQRQMDKKKGSTTTFKHLRDDITVGKEQDGTYLVGFGHDTYWRAHFPELGTANQAPNPFIEKAMEESAAGARVIMETLIRKGLGL